MQATSVSGLSNTQRRATQLVLFVLGFAAATALSLQLRVATGASALWISNAVLASGLLLLEKPLRPLFVALALVAVVLIAPVMTGYNVGPPFYIYLVSNLLEAIAIAWLAAKLCGPRLDFSQWRQLLLLAVGAILPVCLVNAVIGGGLLMVFSNIPPERTLWFQSHALGAMLMIPAVTILARPRRYRMFSFGPTELFAVVGAFAAFSVGVFLADFTLPLLFLLFPALVFLAFRYGPVGATLGVITVGVLALHFTFVEGRAFAESAGMTVLPRIQLMQAFLAVLFFTSLPVAGAVATSRRMKILLARRTVVARSARQKAERASKARAEFLANMSHEIRTPLNGVLGLADALWRTELKPEQRDMLKMILSSGKALTGLLSDALDLARADSGQMEISEQPFDVRALIEEAAFPFEHLAGVKGLSFETVFEGEIPRASVGDPLRIRQILGNLVSNAIKFTDKGGVRLVVTCEKNMSGKRFLRVSVEDTGIGMDDEMQSRLFRRFEQGDNSVTRRYGGCGLGLSIANKLSEMMGGRLECVSAPGHGATFTLHLPLSDGEAAPETVPAAESVEAPAQEGKLRVLLAEDHPVNQKVVQIILGDLVEMTTVDNGAQAVEAVKQAEYDVVLMDTHMPVMDGLTAIRAIRGWEIETGQRRLPIVSLTADAMPQQIAAAMAAGADLHLSKPITGESLVNALEESQTLPRDVATMPSAKAG
jgi:signal transduction histidine kinase/ActR/RegA family two-component response regulator